MAERLTFTLDGRDNLSRVLGHAGQSADRLRRTMEDAADGSGQALLTLTQDADGRLRDLEGRFVSTADAASLMAHRTGQATRPMADWNDAADKARAMGAELRKSFLGLTPAILPAAAALAPVAASAGLGAVAIGAYGLAVGKQIGVISEAAKAEEKYRAAVEDSGATSAAATKAQIAYAKQMAALPPATRQAAAALSVLKDTTQDWSDSLADVTMAPITHGVAVLNDIVPRLTPTVRGAAKELDRFVTIAAGQVASPGFTAFTDRLGKATTGALHRANDALIRLMRTADTSQVGAGVSEFMDYARAQGPVLADTLQNVATALVNVLNGASGVGVSMLSVVNVLSDLIASVPPGAIANLLQLAIAIKAVRLAALGLAAGRGAMLAFTGQMIAMQTAAAGSTTRMGALTAAFGTMSRGAKLALAGSGIGLLVIALAELSQAGRQTPPDVDKLTLSLKELGKTGEVTGEAAKVFSGDLSGLYDKVRSLTDPSTTDDIQQWIVSLGGLASWDSTPVAEATEHLEAIDQVLTSMVSNGNADLAAAAARRLSAAYVKGGGTAEQFTKGVDGYQNALANAKFEQELAAEAMGIYGKQAQETKTKLDQQKQSADALRQALFALSNVNRDATGATAAYEAAVDAATDAAKQNGRSLRMVNGELDLSSDKARANEAALRDLAAKTEAAAGAADEQGRSNAQVNGILDKGRKQLIEHARQMGLDKQAADALAKSYLGVPNRTARLKGNIEDLQAKVATAKKQLANVPDGRKAQIRANISQLEGEIWRAKRQLAGIPDERVGVSIYLKASSWDQDANGIPDAIQSRAHGGIVGFPRGGPVRGPGTATSDSILTRVSNGEYVIRAAAVEQYGLSFMDRLNAGRLGIATAPPRPALAAVGPGRGVTSTTTATAAPTIVNHFHIEGAMDPVRVGKEIQRVLTTLKRNNGGGSLGLG